MKKIVSAVCILFALIMLASLPISAAKPYQTYTYALGKYALYSPDAYTPVRTIDSAYMGIEKKIDDPRDIFVDDQMNVYIADSKNNRIVVLDRYYKFKFEIGKFTNQYGVADSLAAPAGVFVTEDRIFVCDTDKNRIVTFDRKGNYITIIAEPESELFEEGSVYKPVAIAVDQYNRLYVVSSTTYQGIIVMTDEGQFISLIGAQKVVIGVWDAIWRRFFMTDEQKELMPTYVPTEFNNITINKKGFIYVTTSSIDAKKQQSTINSKSKSGDYAPVKMLNNNGTEIMRRNGFWPPAGEIKPSTITTDDSITGVSVIVDVAMGPENTWSIIDEKRQKVFTYDFEGNLLFAFGDGGKQLGNLASIEGIVYQGDLMLILDKTNDNITVYKRTEYGDILIQALANQNNNLFDKAVEDWTEILKRNSNFDAAYIGIGQSLTRLGRYEESLEYFRAAYDTENYSTAYKEIRKEWLSKFFLLIPLVIILICVGWAFFMKYCKKVNNKGALRIGKKTFKEELLYVFHVMFHPFDGFWDLKHEKRGSIRASIVFITITVFAFFYQAIGGGYVLAPTGTYTTIFAQAQAVLVPLALFAIANWCLTTLFEGEGSFKDIVIAISYSLIPLPLVIIPTTIISNFIIKDEMDILNFVISLAFIWTGFMIFFGMMVTHDYSMGKNILTTLGTIVGMVFIMFVAILFTTLLRKLFSFVSNIILELQYRM